MTNQKNNMIEQWIRPEIRALSAYHVPDPGDMIKLDAMENPYTWPEDMVQEWQSLLRATRLNRYPDPASQSLKHQLREAFQVPGEMDLLLGNGSDEIIQIIAMAVAGENRTVLAPEPGFVMYKMIATFVGMQYRGVPLNAEDFSLDMDAMQQAIEETQPAVLFLAYPNNPTGNLFDERQVRKIIEMTPGLVVVDEAYAAFADHSFMSILGEYDNLVVMRTVSKMGLAGLRLGYLAGSPDWLHEFDKIRLPYNINVLTQRSAEFALLHKSVLDQQTETLKIEREKLYQSLQQISGLTVFPSQANFLLLRTPSGKAGGIFASLKAQGVLIKNLSTAGGMLSDCLRVTVGKPGENRLFIEALKKAL